MTFDIIRYVTSSFQSEYGGVQDVRMRPELIWMPDILLFESSSATFDPTYPSNIVVSSNGDCNFVPPGIFKSTCSIDMTWNGAAVAVVAASPTHRHLSSVSARCPCTGPGLKACKFC